MQMNTGKYGNEDSFRNVAKQDAQVAAEKINDIDEERKALGGKKGTEKWDASKIAKGQAIAAVLADADAISAVNSFDKEHSKNHKDTLNAAFMGAEEQGRHKMNKLLGIGKKWEKMTATGKDVALMSKVQGNAQLAEIGGITSAHKAIEVAGSVDKAMDVANTLAAAKAGSDITSIKAHNGSKGFISDAIDSTFSQESKSHLATNILNNKDLATAKAKAQILSGKTQEEKKSLLEYAKHVGMVTKGSTLNDIVGTTGDEARKAYAIMGAGSADRDAVIMMDGKRMNTSLDVGSVKALTNVDSSTANKSGHNQDTGEHYANAVRIARARLPKGTSEDKIQNLASNLQHSADLTNDLYKNKVGFAAAAGADAIKQVAKDAGIKLSDDDVNKLLVGGGVAGIVALGETTALVTGNKSPTGKVIKKTVSAGRAVKSAFSGGSDQSINEADYSNKDKPASENKNSKNHINTPKENYKLAQDNVSNARQSLEDYNEKLTQEQGRKNPNAKKMSEFQNGISQAEREMEVNKQLAKESKFKMDHPVATKVEGGLTKLTKLAEHTKSLGEGFIYGEVMSDAPKMSMYEGDYNLARVQAAPNNVFQGAVTGAMALMSSAGSKLDAILPGTPMNDLSQKYLGANLSTVTSSLLNQSGTSFSNAGQNILNLGSSSQNVAGYPTTHQQPITPTQGSQYNPQTVAAPPVNQSPAPTHAQTAFTTPPGYNTQQAMQGNMGGFNNGFITARDGGYSGASGGYMADSVVRQTTASEIHYGKMEKVAVETFKFDPDYSLENNITNCLHQINSSTLSSISSY